MCIELLEKCRETKQANESAVFEVGRSFGEALEKAYGDIPEVRDNSGLNRLAHSGDFTIENLKNSFVQGRILFAKAFDPAIKRNAASGVYTIGIRFPEDSKVRMQGCEVAIDEAPFVKGFIEGFNQSRSSR